MRSTSVMKAGLSRIDVRRHVASSQIHAQKQAPAAALPLLRQDAAADSEVPILAFSSAPTCSPRPTSKCRTPSTFLRRSPRIRRIL